MAVAIKKTAAIAIAAGLTFAGSAGVALEAATPAVAQAQVAPAAPNMPDTVNLQVHKRVNPGQLGKAGTGNASTEVQGNPIQGAQFTLTPITVTEGAGETQRTLNFNDQADFNILAKMKLVEGKPVVEGATATLGTPSAPVATNESGTANFSNMPVGAYLVTETQAAPVAAGVNGRYVKSAPFIVFLPMVNAEGTGWLETVHAYPKNSYLELDKDVVDADKNTAPGKGQDGEAAGAIKYTVKATVPSDLPGRQRDQFGVVDVFDNRELVFTDQNAPVQKVTINGAEVNANDYAVTRLTSDAAKAYAPEEVGAANVNDGYYISFKKPWELPADGKVEIVFKDANMANGGDDKVDNTVRLVHSYRAVEDNSTPDNPPTTTTPSTPPPTTPPGTPPGDEDVPHVTVSTYKAKIQIFKFAELNNQEGYQAEGENKDTPLAGAEFALYRCDAENRLLNATLEPVTDAAQAQVVRSGSTDKDGNLTFEGLHSTSYENDAAIPATIDKGYCLKETKAPRGYLLNENVQRIKLDHANGTTNADTKVYSFTPVSQQIGNKPDTNTPPLLPATGGMGILIVVLAGLAIIGGGAYAARRNSAA